MIGRAWTSRVTVWQFIGNLDNELAPPLLNCGGWIRPDPVPDHLLRDGTRRRPVPAGRLVAVRSGALWATADVPVELLALTLITASFCGDNCNYWIGRLFGSRTAASAFAIPEPPGPSTERTSSTRATAWKTIVLARFAPHRAHICPVCCRHRAHGLPPLPAVQCRRGGAMGRRPGVRRSTRSASCADGAGQFLALAVVAIIGFSPWSPSRSNTCARAVAAPRARTCRHAPRPPCIRPRALCAMLLNPLLASCGSIE